MQRKSDKTLDRNAAILDIVRKARSAVQEVLEEQLNNVEIVFTPEEARRVANRANDELKPVRFIGQFENVSKWISRTSSIYADPIETEEHKQ